MRAAVLVSSIVHTSLEAWLCLILSLPPLSLTVAMIKLKDDWLTSRLQKHIPAASDER
jgi:hypothetical protein